MQDLGCGLRRKVRVAPVEHLCTLRKSFGKPKGARKVALQGVGADLFASVGCRSAVKLWSLSGVHLIAKLSLRACLVRVRVKTFLWILAYAEDLSGCSLW